MKAHTRAEAIARGAANPGEEFVDKAGNRQRFSAMGILEFYGRQVWGPDFGGLVEQDYFFPSDVDQQNAEPTKPATLDDLLESVDNLYSLIYEEARLFRECFRNR